MQQCFQWGAIFLEAGKTGMGMFIESYFLFAIGNIEPIWELQYPTCFDDGELINTSSSLYCDGSEISSITYVEVICIILGMLFFGSISERIGRKWGSRSTIFLMFIGSILMTFANGDSIALTFVMFDVGLSILAFGVGGEFPFASTTSSENSEHMDAHKRGRSVGLTFALQGWGNFTNTLVLFLLVLGSSTYGCIPDVDGPESNSSSCQAAGLNWTWRASYLIGLLFLVAFLFYRFVFLRESRVWEERQGELNRMDKVLAKDHKNKVTKQLFLDPFYALRLFACSLIWFLWDIVFYGNKLFQSTIIAVTIGGQPTLYDLYAGTLINASVGVVGYYLMAFTVDKPWMGRTRMQAMGFSVLCVLFLICGLEYDYLTLPENVAGLQAMYYLTSLWSQWGPNGTTFILPVELFPTDVRAFTHGIAASFGKLGALTATLVFSFGNNGLPLSVQNIFIVNGVVSFLGLVLTVLFIPNTGKVTLKQVDRLWRHRMDHEKYVGSALKARNLSLVEVWWVVPTQEITPLHFHIHPLPPQPSRLGEEEEEESHHSLRKSHDETILAPS